jgi:hypothetical protein
MAKWFQTRKEDLPENIRELEPDKLSKAVKDAEEWGTELVGAREKLKDYDTLKAKADGADAQKTELDTVKARLAELEGNQDTDRNKDSNRQKGPASVFVNEDEAFNARLAPILGAVTQTGALAARATAREAIQNAERGHVELKIWNKYQGEINTLMAKENPTNQINPNSWVNAFIYVKGLHVSELMDHASKKTDVFAEVGSQSGNMGGGNDESDKDKLSPQELDIAKKFKMTPEKYLERKKAMKFVSA